MTATRLPGQSPIIANEPASHFGMAGTRHVLRIIVLCRALDAVALQVLQRHFPDDSPRLRTLGERTPGILG